MQVHTEIDETLKARRELREVMNSAADLLASRDRDPISQVMATWQLIPDTAGRPVINLKLVDEQYATTRTFTPNQLIPPDLRTLRLLAVWNDLLRARSHRDAERVNELIGQ